MFMLGGAALLPDIFRSDLKKYGRSMAHEISNFQQVIHLLTLAVVNVSGALQPVL